MRRIKNWARRIIFNLAFKRLQKRVKNMKGSWKTSLTGWIQLIIGVLGAVLAFLVGDSVDLEPIWVALAALGITIPNWLQGLFARDDNVSSEEVKAVHEMRAARKKH